MDQVTLRGEPGNTCVTCGTLSLCPVSPMALQGQAGRRVTRRQLEGGCPKALLTLQLPRSWSPSRREALMQTVPHPGWVGSAFPRGQGLPLQTVPIWVSWIHSGCVMSGLGDGLIIQSLRQQVFIKFQLFTRFCAPGGLGIGQEKEAVLPVL